METQEYIQLQQELSMLKTEVSEIKQSLNINSNEKRFTVIQVAALLGLKPSGVNWHIRAGHIKASGKRNKLITETELNNYIKTITKPEAKS